MTRTQDSCEATFCRVQRANDGDAPRWDRFVESHPSASPYHRWAWKNAMEQAYGIRTHYYLAENSGGAVIGILPAARSHVHWGEVSSVLCPIVTLAVLSLANPLSERHCFSDYMEKTSGITK